MRACNLIFNILKWPFKVLAVIFLVTVLVIGVLTIIPLTVMAFGKDCNDAKEGFKSWYQMIAEDIGKVF